MLSTDQLKTRLKTSASLALVLLVVGVSPSFSQAPTNIQNPANAPAAPATTPAAAPGAQPAPTQAAPTQAAPTQAAPTQSAPVQTSPNQAAPTQAGSPAGAPSLPSPELTNPQQPEKQPDLAVDRDPIPSPDIPEPENAANTKPGAPAVAGQIQKSKEGVYTLHEDVDEVLLSCAVVDEKGRPIEDLRRDAFQVWEDGAPQNVSSFLHQDLPVSLGILVDNSGSMRDKREAVASAAMRLLQESNRKDAAFVVNFNQRAFLDQGFTTDLVALHRGLSHFDSRGTTALYDAVAASADELAHHARHSKQVLLIVTDGADNASRLTLPAAIRRVQNLGGPVVYTIGLLYDTEKQEAQKAHDELEALSAETGGIAYFPKSIDDVDTIASEVAQDIRNQYTVGYHSTHPASQGGYRTVRVEAQARGYKHLTVRTRRGYFAKTGQRKTMAEGETPTPAADSKTPPAPAPEKP